MFFDFVNHEHSDTTSNSSLLMCPHHHGGHHPGPILFVPQPNPEHSQRDRELRNAACRSHIAARMHSRRYQKEALSIHSDHAERPTTKGYTAYSIPPEDVQIRLPSISTLLGQGRTDPFAASTAHDLSPSMHRILDYGERLISCRSAYASHITD